MHVQQKEFHDLLLVIQTLRGENGCPWDKQQTLETMKKYLEQEFAELMKAFKTRSSEEIMEEMGDVMFLLLFTGEIAREEGYFTIEDVLEKAKEKLIRRHPHIFGDVVTDDIAEIKKNWGEIKEQEKLLISGQPLIERIPRNLPLLLQALWASRKLSKTQPGSEGPLEIIEDLEGTLGRVREVDVYEDSEKATQELGHLLFAAISLCRLLHVNPEKALRACLARVSEPTTHDYGDVGTAMQCLEEATQDKMASARKNIRFKEEVE